jgi:hypothetical protein
MYVVVRKYRPLAGVNIEQEKEVIRKNVTKNFVPQVEKLSGFINYTLAFLTDGTVMSVSIFNREASVGESIRLASLWINENIPRIFEKNPEVFVGEVAVQDGKLMETSDTKKKKSA